MEWLRSMLTRVAGPAALAVGLLVGGASSARVESKCKHTVKKGDTVSHIALRAGVSEANLLRANPTLAKNPGRLRIGQVVEICKAKRFEQSRPRKCGTRGRLIAHKVRSGETLGGVAAHYSVSRASIRKHNSKLKGRRNDMIRVGETLRVCTSDRRYTHRSWLKAGIQLPEGEGYEVRRPHRAWGTPYAISSIVAAMKRYRELEPDAPPVEISDISTKTGGPLGSHLSHQEGRDVDINYVFEPSAEPTRTAKMDLARTWSLLRSFVEDETVSVIFVDNKVQRRLYEYAQSIGVASEVLDPMFQYPRNGDHEAVLYHWQGHTRHFHVRFRNGKSDSREDEDEDEDEDDGRVASTSASGGALAAALAFEAGGGVFAVRLCANAAH